MKQICAIILAMLTSVSVYAKEPTNWFFGAGIGAGLSQIDKVYPESANNQIGVKWGNWTSQYSSTVKDTGVAWEVLLGYKHFINNWIGFRYYANVGVQHYKDEVFTAGKVKAGVVEYTGNLDVLINFYTAERWSIGILGGASVGGAYFDSPAMKTYQALWTDTVPQPVPSADNSIYKGQGKVYKHHFNAALSVGVRGSYFQKIRDVGNRTCNSNSSRVRCRVPVSYLEHSFEVIAKFPLMQYNVTDPGDVITGYTPNTGVDYGTFVGIYQRPGYVVKNPYKVTVRYIFAF